jgi:hypothetical protein
VDAAVPPDAGGLAVPLWNGMLLQSAHGGSWLPAMRDSDAHSERQVIGLPHSVVLADNLITRDVLAGLKAGRTWIAESAGVDLAFTATGCGRGSGIGGRLQVADDTQVTAELEVSGMPNGTMLLISDEGQTHAETQPPGGGGTVRWQTTPAVSAYLRAEVRHPSADPTGVVPGAMAALTDPIFLGRR